MQSAAKPRILILSSLYPPDILGGAEQCAANYARMCRDNGYEVGVLTTANAPDDALADETVDGVRMWRVHLPRLYPMYRFPQARAWQKLLWHLQDYFDPRNVRTMQDVLDRFKPDLVAIHLLQGLGYNALKAIARRGVPVLYTLHDPGLVCLRANMFRNGTPCAGQCGDCGVATGFKMKLVRSLKDVRFCSPSRANFETVARHSGIGDYPHRVILNAEHYPPATVSRQESPALRLLFVGRLHKAKGVDILLQVVESLAAGHTINVTIVGSGQEEAALKARWGNAPWCRFAGFLSHAEISNHMVNSDLLCVPSVWPENSPGVIVHALSLGLPVLGSRIGGIPELVEAGVTGDLATAGDVEDWTRVLVRILQDSRRLAEWRDRTATRMHGLTRESIERQHLDYIKDIIS